MHNGSTAACACPVISAFLQFYSSGIAVSCETLRLTVNYSFKKKESKLESSRTFCNRNDPLPPGELIVYLWKEGRTGELVTKARTSCEDLGQLEASPSESNAYICLRKRITNVQWCFLSVFQHEIDTLGAYQCSWPLEFRPACCCCALPPRHVECEEEKVRARDMCTRAKEMYIHTHTFLLGQYM